MRVIIVKSGDMCCGGVKFKVGICKGIQVEKGTERKDVHFVEGVINDMQHLVTDKGNRRTKRHTKKCHPQTIKVAVLCISSQILEKDAKLWNFGGCWILRLECEWTRGP